MNSARKFAALIAIMVTLLLAGTAGAVQPNPGTIKVHDDAVADPDEQNEPHVSCDFWIEGIGMHESSGSLSFKEQPPTGTDDVVPTGDGLDWTADMGDESGEYHFLNGPYQLPDGHYKVTSTNGVDQEKTKVFFVDECEVIPFFPTTGAIVLGVIGSLGVVGAVMLRRRG